MFAKLLIANRGEIACRIIRTCRRMGIATVAVYSDADVRAPHVELADEAIRIGPAAAAQSYLDADAILVAAQRSGADAVHPGYGFLSERAAFAELLAANGIAFIGPPPSAIAAMGDKIQSKRIAAAAGVSTIPGFVGAIDHADHAAELARDIGYPVMLKASAGGGGKGMRVAASEIELRQTYESVRREALAGFGDDRLLVERFIENPRHIEIQLLGDQHGAMVHLGERECSIQRRHQKVVEEAPSPFVTATMREAMSAQAIALARAVGYHSAGTVEFVVSPDRSFYFLEMNTRLQVEHPITECVTGLDLVEQMIRVAAGEPLGFSQADVRQDGWAIETRVYAEDPYSGFLPSTGRLVRYRPPKGEGIRVDDGVSEGSDISMFYDPMIAKLVTYAPTRPAAIDAQIAALDRFEIAGVGHNVDFLSALMQHPRFRAGELTTAFIAEEFADGFHGMPADEEALRAIAAVAAGNEATLQARARKVTGQLGEPPAVSSEWIVRIDGRDFHVVLGIGQAVVDGTVVEGTCDWLPGRRTAAATANGRALGLIFARERGAWRITTRGATHQVRVLEPRVAALMRHMIERPPPDRSRLIVSPMPGLLRVLHAAVGDRIEPGQPLAVIEAMKMENVLRAGRSGSVVAIHVAAGDTLTADQVIFELD